MWICQKARRRSGLDDGDRMGLERHDRVGVADDLAMAEMDAVEGPDRDPPRARLHVGQVGELHARKPTTGFSPPSFG